MPFARENIKFTVLTIGLITLCLITSCSAVMVAQSKEPTAVLYTTAIGFPVTVGMQLLNMLWQQVQARDVKHDVRGAIQHTELAVSEVAETVKHATNGELDKRIEAAVDAALAKALPPLIERLSSTCACKAQQQ